MQPSFVLAHLLTCITILAPVSHALNSCFKTDNYNATRGQPFVITWPDDNSIYDLSLDSTEGEFVGYIARNVTDTSLIWTPPLNITDGPYYLALKNLDRQSTCQSQNFTVRGSADSTVTELSGPLAVTVVTINSLLSTVTATVAYFTPTIEVNALTTASATTTSTPIASAAPSATATSKSSSKGNGLTIGISVGFGALVLIVLVLGALLWRARRKKKVQPEAPNETYSDTKHGLRTESPSEELDSQQRMELSGQERNEIDSRVKPQGFKFGTNYTELDNEERRTELDAGQTIPIEMPAEVPVSWNKEKSRPSSIISTPVEGLSTASPFHDANRVSTPTKSTESEK